MRVPVPAVLMTTKPFDFWVGDWTVYNNGGGIIGTNKVVKMIDGCVLQENWEASNKTNTGTSYNFFDSSDSTWNQVWVSNTGNVLRLNGHIDKEGAMVLKSELVNCPKGNYYNQITWTKNGDASVTQRWDILNESNQPLSKAFEGIYKKTEHD
jgi:hypothetical protein